MSSDEVAESAIYLSLGSNLGNREEQLSRALRLLEAHGIEIVTCSSLYRTDPLYVLDQPHFLNLVCEVSTRLSPRQLLDSCLAIERQLGRTRRIQKGPREIDLDILYFGQAIIEEPSLVVPHPHLGERNFVLVPLVEIAPEFHDPRSGLTIAELRDRCQDQSGVEAVGRLEW
ncbi:MAG: 2-amino-4-hydroxy-6-hydroxymethyldihydropteridine diphosphokinase [Acidobacteria bacterium]|nr:MAG: 2-amino-4-hydroxy-6-hydroxymethyldihydropteridine diphosphokinase [Acidobacteriota bacterium]